MAIPSSELLLLLNFCARSCQTDDNATHSGHLQQNGMIMNLGDKGRQDLYFYINRFTAAPISCYYSLRFVEQHKEMLGCNIFVKVAFRQIDYACQIV